MIDYILVCENKDLVYEKYLKYAWKDINWRTIFERLGLDLNVLYDNVIDYWSTEQLKTMLNLFIDLSQTDLELGLKLDIEKLIEFFTFYVKNDCKIWII